MNEEYEDILLDHDENYLAEHPDIAAEYDRIIWANTLYGSPQMMSSRSSSFKISSDTYFHIFDINIANPKKHFKLYNIKA